MRCGNTISRAAIQVGLKGSTLKDFLASSIYSIEDITPQVRKWNEQRKKKAFIRFKIAKLENA